MMTVSTFTRHEEIAWRGGQAMLTSRLVAEETAVALSYNGSTHAVMMVTPADLEDFGIGFTLTEGIVENVSDIESIELIPSELGIEVRMWLGGDRAASLAARRRAMLAKHPEIDRLYGPCPRTKYVCTALVLLQFGTAYALRSHSRWVRSIGNLIPWSTPPTTRLRTGLVTLWHVPQICDWV